MTTSGLPLADIRILELAAKGPGPFGVMLLADLGADVVRVDRVGGPGHTASGTAVERGRRTIGLDLKRTDGVELLLELADRSDVLVEGYRPGVAERLGFGPEVCLARNPRLVYARVTGWGQTGPLAERAGHDLNFLAVSGALHPLGPADAPPPPPLNLVGDFGGGGTYLAIGVLAALLERQRSGRGQVLDVAMVDGVSSLLTVYHDLHHTGAWSDERESNIIDGAAPCYRTYRTSDERFMAVAALEPAFYAELLDRLGLDAADWPQFDRQRWPDQRTELARIFAGRTRAEWEKHFEGSDACVTPVLTLPEAARSAQLTTRDVFVTHEGAEIPAAAPRLSRTPARIAAPSATATEDILSELGLDAETRDRLLRQGVAG